MDQGPVPYGFERYGPQTSGMPDVPLGPPPNPVPLVDTLPEPEKKCWDIYGADGQTLYQCMRPVECWPEDEEHANGGD